MDRVLKGKCPKYSVKYKQYSKNCRKQKSYDCLTTHKKEDTIKLKDAPSASLTIKCHKESDTYKQILVDGCLMHSKNTITKQKKCDWMIYNPDNKMICLVELKKSFNDGNISIICEQFMDTINFLGLANYDALKFILVSYSSSISSSQMFTKAGYKRTSKSVEKFGKKYQNKFIAYHSKNYAGGGTVVEDYDVIFSPINSPSKTTP